MRSYTLSKREVRLIQEDVSKNWPDTLGPHKIKDLKVVEIDEGARLFLSPEFKAVNVGKLILPYLGSNYLEKFPGVVVDSGAVRFVVSGANVMRPGIVSFRGDFEEGDVVAVSEEKYAKFLAVGLAEVDSDAAREMVKGPIVRNLHYTGDKFWEAGKNFQRS